MQANPLFLFDFVCECIKLYSSVRNAVYSELESCRFDSGLKLVLKSAGSGKEPMTTACSSSFILYFSVFDASTVLLVCVTDHWIDLCGLADISYISETLDQLVSQFCFYNIKFRLLIYSYSEF